jgi:DNA-binding transcriptional MerR regulator
MFHHPGLSYLKDAKIKRQSRKTGASIREIGEIIDDNPSSIKILPLSRKDNKKSRSRLTKKAGPD